MRAQMAQHWLHQGLQVGFVLCQGQGELLGVLPTGATVFDLAAPRIRNAIWPLVRYLRNNKPDALLVGMWPLTVIAPLAARLANYKGRVVISEHAPQSLSHASRGIVHNAFMSLSMRLFYPLASARVAVSSGVADDMARLSGVPRSEMTVIHNPAATGRLGSREIRPHNLPPLDGPLILSVGTLKAVKRHDLLIEAFSRARLPNATLCILGEGRERAELESLAVKFGVKDRLLLPGYQSDTVPWYTHADLFVLCSDHEGFGNVIVEALEQGVPVVSTDCPSGPREILDNGRFGTLVPVGDAGALAAAMENALLNDHDHDALRRRAQDFSVSKAADAYLKLLSPTMERPKNAGEASVTK